MNSCGTADRIVTLAKVAEGVVDRVLGDDVFKLLALLLV